MKPPFNTNRRVIVIGAGFAGLSAAATLANAGYTVTILEKHSQTGGRARLWKHEGFSFDMGPSWYWMPDVMEDFFRTFDKTSSDYFDLIRIDPSYQVVFAKDDVFRLPASYDAIKDLFERTEKGSAAKLDEFLKQAEYKYTIGINEFVHKPSLGLGEFLDKRLLSSIFRLDMFRSFAQHIRQFVSDRRLLQILSFPVLFLGATPSKTPALYSLMNYADMKLGTWYPMGGMYKLVEAMESVTRELGVDIRLDTTVEKINVRNGVAYSLTTSRGEIEADIVLANADYYHVENELLDSSQKSYSERYWSKRTLAPSCLLYYVGVNKRIPKLQHHNLFFDGDLDLHADAIYTNKRWPEEPVFYLCAPSVTDDTVAPAGMENLFILIPVATGLQEDDTIKNLYFDTVMTRIEAYCAEEIRSHVVVKRFYGASDFNDDYNAYKGNAYGLANTLTQTALLRPSIRSKKIQNLYYTGQFTVPGPGVPPSIISGQVVAKHIANNHRIGK